MEKYLPSCEDCFQTRILPSIVSSVFGIPRFQSKCNIMHSEIDTVSEKWVIQISVFLLFFLSFVPSSFVAFFGILSSFHHSFFSPFSSHPVAFHSFLPFFSILIFLLSLFPSFLFLPDKKGSREAASLLHALFPLLQLSRTPLDMISVHNVFIRDLYQYSVLS